MTNESAPQVLLYTTPTCPDCRNIKAWLSEQGVSYAEYDLTEPAVADHAKTSYGVRVAPITVFKGEVLYGTYANQLPRLRELFARELVS